MDPGISWRLGLAGALLLPGCLGGDAGASAAALDVAARWGNDFLRSSNGTLLINGSWLEGRLVGDAWASDWSDTPVTQASPARLTIEKPEPDKPGGGVKRALDVLGTKARLEVRLKNSQGLEGYDLRLMRSVAPMGGWAIQDCPESNGTLGYVFPADQTFAVPVTVPGVLHFRADLEREGGRIAVFCRNLLAGLGAHWVVESTLRPVGAHVYGTETPDYGQMTDAFSVLVGDTIFAQGPTQVRGALNATTAYRGTWDASHGQHLELALATGGMTWGACDTNDPELYNYDPYNPQVPPPPSGPGVLAERAVGMPLSLPGTYEARVGALGSECVRHWGYANQGPVPYTLQVALRFMAERTPVLTR